MRGTLNLPRMSNPPVLKKNRITEADFKLANRRAARLKEIEQHGKPVSFIGIGPADHSPNISSIHYLARN